MCESVGEARTLTHTPSFFSGQFLRSLNGLNPLEHGCRIRGESGKKLTGV
jgi:hypothetical protein